VRSFRVRLTHIVSREGEITTICTPTVSTSPDVLGDAVQEQGRLAHACLAHDVRVPAAVLWLDPEIPPDVAVVRLPEDDELLLLHGISLPHKAIHSHRGKVVPLDH